jgi:hypothetical protein
LSLKLFSSLFRNDGTKQQHVISRLVEEEQTMTSQKQKLFAAASALVLMTSSIVPAAFAQYGYGYRNGYHNSYRDRWRDDYRRDRGSSYTKNALLGGGAGAIIGGLVGEEGNKGSTAVKGALLGAGAGLGYQYLKRQGTFRNW